MDGMAVKVIGWTLAMLATMLLAVGTAGADPYPRLDSRPKVESLTEGDVALIVAVEDYAFLPDVPGAVANANAWEMYFRRGMGIEEVHVLTNRQASREDIVDFAGRAARQVGEGGTMWFVFIGHGAPAKSGKDGVLVGMDAKGNMRSLEARGIAQSELLAKLGEGAQARTVAIFDACFSGRTGGGAALAEGVQPVIPVVEPEIGEGSLVLTAAKADQYAGALPGAERPAFSYLLLGAMRGWADDGDGMVTASEALWFTKRHLRSVQGRQQTPQLDGAGNVVLAKAVEESGPDIGRILDRVQKGGANPPEGEDGETTDGKEEQEEGEKGNETAGGGSCEDGRVAVEDGKCCWPGQDWSGGRCVGMPTSCPEGRTLDEYNTDCVEAADCKYGQVAQSDGVGCCWPGQEWLPSKQRCKGAPECPKSMQRQLNQCYTSDVMQLYRRCSFEEGEEKACHEYAMLLEEGERGLVKDQMAALSVLRRNCEGGFQPSCDAIRRGVAQPPGLYDMPGCASCSAVGGASGTGGGAVDLSWVLALLGLGWMRRR